MTQHDYNIANQIMADARTDINNALASAVTLNAGASAPSTTFAGMLWYDTANSVIKQRNAGDSAWITVFTVGKQGLIPQDGSTIYAADGGSTDAYAITLSPAPTAYTNGMVINFKANTANTGACTLNVNSLGAVALKKNYNADTATGDIVAGQLVQVEYDGTNFQIMSPLSGGLLSSDIGVSLQAYDADTAKTDVAQDFTAQQNVTGGTLTDAASVSWNLSTKQTATLTLGGNRTMDAPTNMVNRGSYLLIVVQDATGSRTITWNSVFKWPGGTAPTLSTAANAVDVISFVSNGTNMYGVAALNFS